MDLTNSLILHVWVSWFFGIPWLLISWCFSFPFLFFLFLFFLCCLLYTACILWHPLLMKLFTYQKKKDLRASRPCMNGPHQFPHSLLMHFLVFWNPWLLISCCFSFPFLFFPFLSFFELPVVYCPYSWAPSFLAFNEIIYLLKKKKKRERFMSIKTMLPQ